MSHVFRHNRKPTKIGFESAFRWLYWHQYTATEASYRATTEGTDLDGIKVRRTYSKREEKGLWWFANCAVAVSLSSAIRHQHSKLLRRAFADALKARGYERDGGRTRDGTQLPLTGTLQIFGQAKAVEMARWEDLQRQCLRMLDTVAEAHHCEEGSSSTASLAQKAVRKQKAGPRGSGVGGSGDKRQPLRPKPSQRRRLDFTHDLAGKR